MVNKMIRKYNNSKKLLNTFMLTIEYLKIKKEIKMKKSYYIKIKIIYFKKILNNHFLILS
jgi:hypothetical protein